VQPLTPQSFVRALVSFVLGIVAGVLGTVIHRSTVPWGLLAALGLVLAFTVTVRAWAGWPGYVGIAGGVFLALMVLTQTGPGGDVLVPGGENVDHAWLGVAWLGGAMVALIVAAGVPRRWFDPTPRPPRVPTRPDGTGGSEQPTARDEPATPARP